MSEQPEQSLNLSLDQLKELIADAIRVAKEPDPATQAKLDEEARQVQVRREEALELARIEIEQRELGWASCSHTKENGKPSIGGQVHSDGLYHPICLRCQKPFPTFKYQGETAAQGVS
jgi:hypothetical protein